MTLVMKLCAVLLALINPSPCVRSVSLLNRFILMELCYIYEVKIIDTCCFEKDQIEFVQNISILLFHRCDERL